MLGKTLLLASMLLIVQGAVRAAEPIECAFGICLGRSNLKLFGADKVKLSPTRWGVKPPIRNPELEFYTIEVVPDSGVVAAIEGATNIFDQIDEKTCQRKHDLLMESLVEKYGEPSGGGKRNKTVWRSVGGRTITLECAQSEPPYQAIYLQIVYRDEGLSESASKQMKEELRSKTRKGL